MPKTLSQQFKQKCHLFVEFIESLSKKDSAKCNKLAQKMDISISGAAKTCIQFLSMENLFKQQRKNSLDTIKKLKEVNSKLTEDVERLSRVKGLKLAEHQKQSNDMLSIIDLVKKGMYIEANRTSRRTFQFIQELIQYDSLKKIHNAIQYRQDYQSSIYGGAEYRDLKKVLCQHRQRHNALSDQVQSYFQLTDEVSDEQTWPQPKYMSQQLLVYFKNIQFKLRTLRAQNRNLHEIINQSVSSEYQSDLVQLSKSSNCEMPPSNQQMQQLSNKIQEIYRNVIKKGKQSLVNKTSIDYVHEIQEYIDNLEKINNAFQKDGNVNGEEIQEKLVIMSLEERVTQLEKIKDKMTQRIMFCIKQVKSMLQQSFIVQVYDQKDEDSVLSCLQQCVNAAVNEKIEHRTQFANLIKQRDNYKNEFNQLNLIQNISVEFQNTIDLMTRHSSETSNREDLIIKIEMLQTEKINLEKENQELRLFRIENQQKIRQLQKILKDKEIQLSSIRSEIIVQQQQNNNLNSCIKNQGKKIQRLQLSASSRDLSQLNRLDDELPINQKQSNKEDFLPWIPKLSNDKDEGLKQLQLKGQIDKLKEQLSAAISEKQSLTNESLALKKTNSSLQSKIQQLRAKVKYETQNAQDLTNQIETLNKLLEDLQSNYNESTETKGQPIEAEEKHEQAEIINSICDKCKQYESQNTEYELKMKEYRKRIKQLQASNLNLMMQSQKESKQKIRIRTNYQACKQVLQKVQTQLFLLKQQQQQQRQEQRPSSFYQEKQQLIEKLALVERQKSTLKQQYDSLKLRLSTTEIAKPVLESAKNPNSDALSSRLHLFSAKGIFEQNEFERQFLLKTLQSQIGPIYQTKFLYSFDRLNKVNFHRYIDNHKHLVVIIKTIYGKLIAAYSQSEVSINGTYRGLGLLIPIWNRSVYRLYEGKKPVTYDDYFLIFGNSQIRIKSQEGKVFSNFGIANGYFNSERKRVVDILGQTEREVEVQTYEIYTIVFEGDRY